MGYIEELTLKYWDKIKDFKEDWNSLNKERKEIIIVGLEKYPTFHYEAVPLSKILIFREEITFAGIFKIRSSSYPIRLSKNKEGQYWVIDGNHRLWSFYYHNPGLPHTTKINCIVDDKIDEKVYKGKYIWEVIEPEINFPYKKPFWKRALNFFGIYLQGSVHFPGISPEIERVLTRKTRRRLEKIETALGNLYADFEKRIWELSLYLREEEFAGRKNSFESLKKYKPKIEALIVETNTEKSLLESFCKDLEREMEREELETYKKELKETITILRGRGQKERGFIEILQAQLRIIDSNKVGENDPILEKELERELAFTKTFLEERKRAYLERMKNKYGPITGY